MKVKLITYTPEPERLIAGAARMCYSNLNIDTLLYEQQPEEIEYFIKMLKNAGHDSPFEHVSFTFAVEDASRSLLTQLTRHRIASYSVQSQRYVNMKNFSPVIPTDIESDPQIRYEFDICLSHIKIAYENITMMLYDKYIANGMSSKEAHKKATENARAVLPNACPTKIIFTMNVRALLHFFELRCCNRAQDEIGILANKMLKLCQKVAPSLFKNAGASCVTGNCKEGKLSCGHQKGLQQNEK